MRRERPRCEDCIYNDNYNEDVPCGATIGKPIEYCFIPKTENKTTEERAYEQPKLPWIKCSDRMPEEKLYEEDTLQGHRKWTESEQVLVCTSNNTYHTEWAHNGHWSSSQFKGIGGDSYEIVAWMPIPKFEEE